MGGDRAYIESLLEGVPLPATTRDLVKYAKREAGRGAGKLLKALPSMLDEVGEARRSSPPAAAPRRR